MLLLLPIKSMVNSTSSSQGEEVENPEPKPEIKFTASDVSHHLKTPGNKKSSPNYWKASHQLLIYWFPNFNNTQHFYVIESTGIVFKQGTKLSNFNFTFPFKVFYLIKTMPLMGLI